MPVARRFVNNVSYVQAQYLVRLEGDVFALCIVNDVLYVMRINHYIYFARKLEQILEKITPLSASAISRNFST